MNDYLDALKMQRLIKEPKPSSFYLVLMFRQVRQVFRLRCGLHHRFTASLCLLPKALSEICLSEFCPNKNGKPAIQWIRYNPMTHMLEFYCQLINCAFHLGAATSCLQMTPENLGIDTCVQGQHNDWIFQRLNRQSHLMSTIKTSTKQEASPTWPASPWSATAVAE